MKEQIARPAAIELASRAVNIDFFASVGTITRSNTIEPVGSWAAAGRLITGEKWIRYMTDAGNGISRVLIRKWLDNEANSWNQVGVEVNAVFKSIVEERIERLIPRDISQKRRIIQHVHNIVGGACIETHFADFVDSDYFRQMYDWLERGYLPCGAVERYPAKHWHVF